MMDDIKKVRTRYTNAELDTYAEHIANSPMCGGNLVVSIPEMCAKLPHRSRDGVTTHVARLRVQIDNIVWAGDCPGGVIPHKRIKRNQDALVKAGLTVNNTDRPIQVSIGPSRPKTGAGGSFDYILNTIEFEAPIKPKVVLPPLGNIYGYIRMRAMSDLLDTFNAVLAADGLPHITQNEFKELGLGISDRSTKVYECFVIWVLETGIC
jgi:hypothetical protein